MALPMDGRLIEVHYTPGLDLDEKGLMEVQLRRGELTEYRTESAEASASIQELTIVLLRGQLAGYIRPSSHGQAEQVQARKPDDELRVHTRPS